MKNTINVKVETLSNLFIGGAPSPFEIGGIDQYTVTTHEGYPYISASSFKGSVRNIAKEDDSDRGIKIVELYEKYLKNEKDTNWPEIKKRYGDDKAALDRMKNRYNQDLGSECLFGMQGFNNAPKLMFGDLYLKDKIANKNECFSIDAKTSIEVGINDISSNPRTYKAVRSGLVFEGEIHLYKMELLGVDAAELCAQYLLDLLDQFNEGIYRLGNSKSRGYGKVKVIAEKNGGQ